MIFQQQLRIPGPAPLPERVVRAASKPMIDHRGPEFAAVLNDILSGVKRVFETENDLILLSSSGSGGLESAVANASLQPARSPVAGQDGLGPIARSAHLGR